MEEEWGGEGKEGKERRQGWENGKEVVEERKSGEKRTEGRSRRVEGRGEWREKEGRRREERKQGQNQR